MKITELKMFPKNKAGSFNNNGIRLEAHEEKTARFLTLFGFNIEVIRPINTPKVRNPDILMSGTIWEMKAPIKYNKNTLQKKAKKASKQAQNVVFDLRNAKNDSDKLHKEIIKLFYGNTKLRKMIIITKDKKVIDYSKK